MKSPFQVSALPSEQFARLFDWSENELRAMNAQLMVVDDKPGFPCRVSLVDAEVGETVLLLTFTHHDVPTPYRGSGPIFVRRGAKTAQPAVGEIPVYLRHRLLSVRAYDASAMIVGSKVLQGGELEGAIESFFADTRVSYLHIHNAAPGCYNCSVRRV